MRDSVDRLRIEKIKRRPLTVDFLNHDNDYACALLATLGFSTALICKKTGLSPCQVSYRLQKARLSANKMGRTDFRNGESPMADMVIRVTKKMANVQLIKHLQAHL